MEKLPEKISFDEVYSLYEGRRDASERSSVEIESVGISDKKGLQSRMNQVAQEAASLYPQIDENSPDGVSRDFPELQINSIPVLARVVDDSIPLTMLVMKAFKHDKVADDHTENVKVELVKGRLDGNNPKDIYAAWRSHLSGGSAIGGLEFAHHGEFFDLKDREIYPKFRQQGFANMLLKTSEEFIRSMATESQAIRVSKASNVGQLDVLCWLWNQGYRPETEAEMDLVQKIFSGDSSLRLSTLKVPGGGQTLSLCVIDANTPEQDRIRQNYRKIAMRVTMVKTIEPDGSKKVDEIGAEVTDEVKSVL